MLLMRFHLLFEEEATASPPTMATIVPPCASTRNLIICCDMAMLPLLNENRPNERAPTVARQPTAQGKNNNMVD